LEDWPLARKASDALPMKRTPRNKTTKNVQPLRRASRAPSAGRPTHRGLDEDLRFWKLRLVRRKYLDLVRPAMAGECCVWIEHEGTGFFFPLGTADEARAARCARDIHQAVVRHGWPRVLATHVREITLAVFWSNHPVTCTYTTLCTEVDAPSAPPARPKNHVRRVAIVEAETGVSRALTRWLNAHSACACVASLASAREALHALAGLAPDLLLFDRHLPDLPGGEFLQKLKHLAPELPAFAFGVYPHSDDIFVSLGGIPEGYFLQRRPPGQLLEPIEGAWAGGRLSMERAQTSIRAYFQGVLAAPAAGGERSEVTDLTQREREILNCLTRGYQDKEIAQALRISPSTVHTHLKSIFAKLGAHTRTEAVMKFLQK
jgi:two-component system NarL family response regulator